MSPDDGRNADDDAATIAAWLDGALDAGDRAAIEARLAADPAFAARVEVERATMARAEALLEQLPLPAGRGEGADLERIRARARRTAPAPATSVEATRPVRLMTRAAMVSFAAAAVIALVAAPRLLRERRSEETAAGVTLPRERAQPTVASVDSASPAAPAPMVAAAPAAESARRTSASRATSAPSVAVRTPATARAGGAAPPPSEPTVATAQPAADAAPLAAPIPQQRDAAEAPRTEKATQEMIAAAPPATATAVQRAAGNAMRARASLAEDASENAIDDATAATLLGTRVPTLRGAVRVALDTTDARPFEGAIAARPLVLARWREPSGRLVSVAMQRGADVIERGPLWFTVGTVRARLVGEFPRAAADSLAKRLVP